MEDDFKIYVLAEMSYRNEFPNETDDDLFPIAWYDSKNYKLKTEIISKAIREHKTVWDLEELDMLLTNN